ncbi:MAG: bifunctional phosphoribosylaminoimidazolecarboxamide formyltransferase/IMP cyclohydrolase, partial [Thermoplasmata archaeon]|nr:bifunctional phosphoribosylaminoimidazolecarboxamide formyltransferase/IMP cyclohydrolase [Thermoplasmata archaeon]
MDDEPRRALISVSDKSNVVKFAKELAELGWEIISTGGTFKELHEGGIDVKRISDIISFPEILDGRVKTLHPSIHAGILAKRDEEHLEQLKKHGLDTIDLVAVNLYPFEETMRKDDFTVEEAIENIDIGGPTMIRAAAKNHENVIIIIEPAQYNMVLKELKEDGEVSLDTRRKLAIEAFSRTAEYDAIISQELGSLLGGDEYPARYILPFRKIQDLRYGENPYQKAAFYSDIDLPEPCIANSKKLKGKDLSFNNILDIDATFEMVKDFDEPTAVIVKHMNPSGVATSNSISEAFQKALGADPLSAYGGIVALNRELDTDTAGYMRKIFLDCIIAPSFHPDSLPVLEKKKVMLLETGPFGPKLPNI